MQQVPKTTRSPQDRPAMFLASARPEDASAFIADRSSDEICRQWQILWKERWARAVFSCIPYLLSLFFLPVALVAFLALINLVAEALYMHLLRGLDPGRDTWRYRISQATVFALELSYSATAALAWQSPDEYAKPFALGMLATTLIHVATVRAIHLPHGITGLVAVYLASMTGNVVYWHGLHNPGGMLAGFVALSGGIGYALTAMISNNRLHHAMAEASIAARSADAAKSLFLAQMSHELRTPMNAIVGLGSFEASRASTPASQDRLNTLVAAARGLTMLLDDILDLSALGQGKVSLRPAVVDAQAEIETVVRLFDMPTHTSPPQIGLEFEQGFPRYLITDAQRLRQCLTNLISNATRHAPAGQIRVRAAVLGDRQPMLRIDVADSGPGVAHAKRALIFEPFEKADPGTPGTGLGLAISRSIARQMGGELTLIDSERGACFRLDLAVHEAPFGYAPLLPASPDLSGRNILVVDDLATNRLVARTLLAASGATVSEARSAAEAMDLIGRHRFDLILLDIHMPEVSGLDALQMIRALPAPVCHVPVLAMTADPPDSHTDRQATARFDGWITKPLIPERLEETLRWHLRGPS